MRLGFVVKPLGRPELKSHDSRRWQNNPHLSVSLAYLRDIFTYLGEAGIAMYRISSELAPYAAHPDMPQFHTQVEECAVELAQLGAMARAAGLRLSFHPGQHTVLNATDPRTAAVSARDVIVQAAILDAMGLGPEAVAVTHLGGVYGDRDAARERFVRVFEALPDAARRRLALENDDVRFTVSDALWAHERTGIRLVFDNLHHRLNSDGRPPRDALAACLATWPADVRPKIHFSTPRTEWLVEVGANPRGRPGGQAQDLPLPETARRADNPPEVRQTRWNYHSDYVNPFEFIDFMRLAEGLRSFDVMLEVRAKDLALRQLREDLARFAPELATKLEPA
jgi:UV DNA damage endonuclease